MTKIVIVDHHVSFRRSLRLMLQEIPEEIEITEIDSSFKFIDDLNLLSPDLVLMDSRLSQRSGIETATIALSKKPTLRIILLTMFNENKYVQEAKNAGIKGLLPKPPSLLELKEAYCAVMNGGFYFPSKLK
ncbi:response regulator transcription factor [Kaistella sp. G5-32]|uniref:Response regulator transcription factor n=1 Tax=Kaistella gelatinilytica TaxID=2787636 RepID=A0ABS0F8A7_9FLAO|nr:response regulator transcription factor [Kaistella gelatinilytica]MBF8455935.1 response regulator transcription factor [Kaistella gelatinilytica]